MHAMTNLGRRWTLEEESFIWRNQGRLTSRVMGEKINRSAAAVLDRLALLRELEQQHTATPERQAVTDEVCRHLALEVVAGRLSRQEAGRRVQNLREELNQADAVILRRSHWPLRRWLDLISQ